MTGIAQFLTDLEAELARSGIRGARRTRIVSELADHLSCDPRADLGDPAEGGAFLGGYLGIRS